LPGRRCLPPLTRGRWRGGRLPRRWLARWRLCGRCLRGSCLTRRDECLGAQDRRKNESRGHDHTRGSHEM